MTTAQLTQLGITEAQWAGFGPFEKLFIATSQRLSAEPDLRWIDLEAGQLEIPEETYPVQFPCALIDFPQTQFQDESRGNQQGIFLIQIRLGIDLYEDLQMVDGKNAPDKGMAIRRLQLITRIHKLLQGFETEYSTPLTRSDIQTERRDDGIKVFTIIYGCAAKDDSAAEIQTTNTGVSLKVNKA